jgi:hypothetical protein
MNILRLVVHSNAMLNSRADIIVAEHVAVVQTTNINGVMLLVVDACHAITGVK